MVLCCCWCCIVVVLNFGVGDAGLIILLLLFIIQIILYSWLIAPELTNSIFAAVFSFIILVFDVLFNIFLCSQLFKLEGYLLSILYNCLLF